MPDVIIKGMEMPESCYDCVTRHKFFRELHCDNLKGMAGPWVALPYQESRHPDCPLRPAPEWISVEKPPEDGTRALVMRFDYVTDTAFMDMLWFDKGVWWNRHFPGDYAVTHWMPLPEPPASNLDTEDRL